MTVRELLAVLKDQNPDDEVLLHAKRFWFSPPRAIDKTEELKP